MFLYTKMLECLGGRILKHEKNFTGVNEVENFCQNTVECIGFNMQGILKATLSPFDNWTCLKHEGGLYVLGIC